MTIEFLSTALLGISLVSGLVVEALKKMLDNTKIKYSSNILAVLTSIIISLIVSIVYVKLNAISITFPIIVKMLTLTFLSFLVTTIGYDKVIQTVKQFIKNDDVNKDNK